MKALPPLLVAAALACQAPAPPTPAAPPATPAPAPAAPVPPTARPEPSNAVTKIVGPATADVLLRGSERATFVIDPRQFSKDATGPDRFAGFKISRTGRPLADDEHSRLVTLLLADTSYLPVDKAVCHDEEAYGLRVGHGAEVVELLLVFPCARVSLLRRASGDAALVMSGEYFDPVSDQISQILRAATRP